MLGDRRVPFWMLWFELLSQWNCLYNVHIMFFCIWYWIVLSIHFKASKAMLPKVELDEIQEVPKWMKDLCPRIFRRSRKRPAAASLAPNVANISASAAAKNSAAAPQWTVNLFRWLWKEQNMCVCCKSPMSLDSARSNHEPIDISCDVCMGRGEVVTFHTHLYCHGIHYFHHDKI